MIFFPEKVFKERGSGGLTENVVGAEWVEANLLAASFL